MIKKPCTHKWFSHNNVWKGPKKLGVSWPWWGKCQLWAFKCFWLIVNFFWWALPLLKHVIWANKSELVEGGNHVWVVHPSLKALKLLVNLVFKGNITIIGSLHVLNVFVVVNGFIIETLQNTRKKQRGGWWDHTWFQQ